MGVLGVGLNTDNGVNGFIQNPFTRTPQGQPRVEDFKEGFIIEELPDEGIGKTIKLVGNQIPVVPFEYGGEQNISKIHYPGNPEANIQVLGAIEDDVTIRGRISAKRFRAPGLIEIPGADLSKFVSGDDLRTLPTAITESLDGIRIRGNLCKFKLGEWVRYGVLQRTHWGLKDLGEYSYEMTFSILSIDEPNINCPIIEGAKLLPIELKSDLEDLNAQLAADATNRQIPDEVPSSLSEILNDATGVVAGAVSGVIGFIDGIISTGEEITSSINRAVGVIKTAEASVSKSYLRVARISYNLGFAGIPVGERYSAMNIFSARMSLFNSMSDVLAKMRRRFEQIAETLPEARRRIKEGDTLQKLSIEFYGNDESWQRIFDHNKLTSTDLSLVRGVVLEIPKLR